NYVGYSNRKLGNYDAALAAYEKALTLKPGYADAIEYRGEAYLGLNRISDTQQAYLDLYASTRAPAAKLLPAMQSLLAAQGAKSAPYRWQLPRGFPTPAVPADNPMSEAKVALGQRLFFDSRLSVTGRSSCASCHDPARSFSDGRPVAIGALGEALPHNALALV